MRTRNAWARVLASAVVAVSTCVVVAGCRPEMVNLAVVSVTRTDPAGLAIPVTPTLKTVPRGEHSASLWNFWSAYSDQAPGKQRVELPGPGFCVAILLSEGSTDYGNTRFYVGLRNDLKVALTIPMKALTLGPADGTEAPMPFHYCSLTRTPERIPDDIFDGDGLFDWKPEELSPTAAATVEPGESVMLRLSYFCPWKTRNILSVPLRGEGTGEASTLRIAFAPAQ